MDPMIIIFAIRGLLRLSREGKAAFDQFTRDHDIIFPDGLKAEWSDVDEIVAILNPDHLDLVTGDTPLAHFWDNTRPANVPGAIEALYSAVLAIKAQELAAAKKQPAERGLEIAGVLMVNQWAEGKGPIGPVSRLALTFADIALEFVGANPSVIGVGGSGEKLIGAMATNLAAMIPDDAEQFGEKSQLAERLAGIFLRAALQALNDNAGALIQKEQIESLVANVLPPLIASLPPTLQEQARWRDVADALLGPAANAALTAVAANPVAFLGRDFDANKILGALTQAVVQEVSRTGLRGIVSDAGITAIYKAAVGVAADRPELFLGAGGQPAEALARELFTGVAAVLRQTPPPFKSDLGAQLAVVALDVVRERGPALLHADQPWEKLLGALVGQIATGLRDGLAQPSGGLTRAFSQSQLLELGRVFLLQVAQTPGLVAPGSRELQNVVGAVAGAMAADEKLLLTSDDWLQIAAVAAREAAENPGRLFKTDATVGGFPATALITDLLGVAAGELAAGGRDAGGVLFGATLREAIALLLEVAGGNLQAAVKNRPALQSLASAVSKEVITNHAQFGAREWLELYRSLLGRALEGEMISQLAPAVIQEILGGEAA